jgi:hypothetical protein
VIALGLAGKTHVHKAVFTGCLLNWNEFQTDPLMARNVGTSEARTVSSVRTLRPWGFLQGRNYLIIYWRSKCGWECALLCRAITLTRKE